MTQTAMTEGYNPDTQGEVDEMYGNDWEMMTVCERVKGAGWEEKGKEKKGRAGDDGGQDERDGCASAWWALQVEHRCSTIAGVL